MFHLSTFKKALFVLLLSNTALLLSSCFRLYDNYLTKIVVISDGSNRDIRLSATEPSGAYFVEGTTRLSAPKGDSITILIDWGDSPWEYMSPRTDDFYFWEVTKVNMGWGYVGPDLYEGSKISESFKVKPGIIYDWDANTGEITNTGERSERINTGGGIFSSGCGSLVKTWTLKSINGNPLPYKQYDDGANSLTWTSGTMTFTSSDTWSSRLVSRQVANGSTNDVNTDRSGTYTCSGGSGSLSNASGNAGTFSVSGGVLTVIDGSFVLTYQ